MTTLLPDAVQQFYPRGPEDMAALDTVYADLDWLPHADGRPSLALNMVASADGRATLGPSSAGLGSSVDQYLMKVLRARADVLLYGAGTLRVDRLGAILPAAFQARRVTEGRSAQPLLAVVTASGEVDLARAAPESPIVVFVAATTPRHAVETLEQRAMVRVAGEARPDLGVVLDMLGRDFGASTVLSEGGPRLNRSLLRAGVLDELFLTVAPSLIAGNGLPLVQGERLDPPTRLDLLSLYAHESELYLRYRVDISP